MKTPVRLRLLFLALGVAASLRAADTPSLTAAIRNGIATADTQYTQMLARVQGKEGFPRTVENGQVKMIKDIDEPIEGKHVILVEDILDTGLTLSYLRQLMLQYRPASLKIATCLDKPERRLAPIEADYVCFKIPNRFVVGYGMDFAERYRGVADIRIYPDTPAGH